MAGQHVSSEREAVQRLLEGLLDALQEVPGINLHGSVLEPRSFESPFRPDAEIRLNAAGTACRLVVEVRKMLYPRDVRGALWRFISMARDAASDHGGVVVPLVAAESISPGARDILMQEHVGFYDRGGSLFIPAPGAYVHIDRPHPKALARPAQPIFTGKRAQVIHGLLCHPHTWFAGKELAVLVDVSPATVSGTLGMLERFEWVTARGKGPFKERSLTAPGALLDEWRSQILARRQRMPGRRYYVSGMDGQGLLDRIAELSAAHHAQYAITGEAAAQRYAPFLSAIRRIACRVMAGRAARELVDALNAREVAEGANLEIIESRSRGDLLFGKRMGTAWLASPVRVYLDLLGSEGRGKEMAEHLRQERIGF